LPPHTQAGDCPDVLQSGSMCVPTCDAGYDLTGSAHCYLGTLTEFRCIPMPCTVASAPEHGGLGNCTSVLQSGDACQPVCNSGYAASGMLQCSLGVVTNVTCLSNPCNVSEAPLNGARGDCRELLASGSICQPTCDEGYTVTGATQCHQGNVSKASCTVNKCNLSDVPDFGDRGDCPLVMNLVRHVSQLAKMVML
jgi:hypothetical protein